MLNVTTKMCSTCRKELSVDMFHKRTVSKDGLRGICRQCARQYQEDNKEKMSRQYREYYDKNKEEKSQQDKIRYQANVEERRRYGREYHKDNRESRELYRKKYYEINKEKIKQHYESNKEKYSQRARAYRKENSERINQYYKHYYRLHPEMRKGIAKRREARKLKLSATLTAEQWIDIKDRFDNRCAYCGKEKPLEQDHFIPISKGGEYTIDNIIPACRSCNARKGATMFFQWYPKYEYYSKNREAKILSHLGYEKGTQQLSLSY